MDIDPIRRFLIYLYYFSPKTWPACLAAKRHQHTAWFLHQHSDWIAADLHGQAIQSNRFSAQKNAAFIHQLAGLLAVVMLILIPFNLFAGSRAIKAKEAASKISLKEWKKQPRAVQSLASEADIRSWAASLPEPPLLPEVFDAPFPVIKNRMINNLTGKVNSVQNQIVKNFRGQ
jgi:hypothetical protein